MLRVDPEECDRDLFQQLAAEGRQLLEHDQPEAASSTLRRALGLWRGPPFVDFTYEPFAQAEIARLEEVRLACLEERIEADLALGRHAQLAGELEALAREQPLRERPRGQLMLALYRSGRQADALEVYRETRELFDRELGIEPGPALRKLEAAILRQADELELPAAPIAVTIDVADLLLEPPSPRPAARKLVTVLVTGPAESIAALDPELRKRLSDGAFREVAPLLERHGATVERSRDVWAMGIFGIPAAYEDDALRAVRAAVELRDTFSDGAQTVRTAIASGEVLTGDADSREPLVTGNPVDVAIAFQQVSSGGEILVDETTRRLVDDAVRVEPIEPGDNESPAWRLLELVPDAPPFLRRFDTPLIGRDAEFSQLRQAFERAQRERRAQLFTVFGEAGIGKTRLALELARNLEGRANVLTGRCLSYGEGITYWPVREIVAQAAGGRSVSELLDESPDADVVAARLETAIGSGTAAAISEEVFWATRKLVEALARESPLILVFEDVHWAELTLLDLIEHLADWVRDAPVLIVCLARPELVDDRPGWAGGKLNATSILLDPLTQEESVELMEELSTGAKLAPEARARVAAASAGNPLFLEQMLALLADSENGVSEIAVPPAIQALLAARLDRLQPDERQALACASIEGEIFHVGGVAHLTESETRETVSSVLMSLVRKELIHPEPPDLIGDEGFRFRHALIRDAAYEGLSKESRSELHARYAAWLERTVGERADEYEEFLGYHLEQAYGYRSELGLVDSDALELADHAAQRLASAGVRAWLRVDAPAAANLLIRAAALYPETAPERITLLPSLGEALLGCGDLAQAAEVLAQAIDRARSAELRRPELHAEVADLALRLLVPPEDGMAEIRRRLEQLLPRLEKLGDDALLARARRVEGVLHFTDCRSALAEQALTRALSHARRAADRGEQRHILWWLIVNIEGGPTPVSEAVRQIETILAESKSEPDVQAIGLEELALLSAMRGEFEEARRFAAEARSIYGEFDLKLQRASGTIVRGWTQLIGQDFEAAEHELRAGHDVLDQMGEKSVLSGVAIFLAETLYRQGRLPEAEEWARIGENAAASDDVLAQIGWRGVRAKVLARRGPAGEALALAREGADLAAKTDWLNTHADALVDQASVVITLGGGREAAPILESAIALYEQKGNSVSAAKARALLDELH